MGSKAFTFADYEKVRGKVPNVDFLVEKVDKILPLCKSIQKQVINMDLGKTKAQIREIDSILNYVNRVHVYLKYYPLTEMAKYFWIINKSTTSGNFSFYCRCPKFSVLARTGVDVETLKGDLKEIDENFQLFLAKIKEMHKE